MAARKDNLPPDSDVMPVGGGDFFIIGNRLFISGKRRREFSGASERDAVIEIKIR